MRVEQTKQPRAIRQTGEKMPVIAFQPAIERTVAHAFEGKQQPERHDFTGVQIGLRMFLGFGHRVIHTEKQFDDRIFGSHGSFLSLQVA
jgi:hypothetical protein